MNGNSLPQSWLDLSVQSPMDPRSIIQSLAFINGAGASTGAVFARSTTFLQNVTWINPPMVVSPYVTPNIPFVVCPNVQDFASVEAANTWNGTHAMTVNNAQLPIAVQKIMFLKAGTAFVNNIFLDFTGAATSVDIQFSFRDNATTSGDFVNTAQGSIPVFALSGTTFSGTGKALAVTLLRTGRFSVGLRIKDNGGNYSMFEMEWIVLP
jgi:hypothetical protein